MGFGLPAAIGAKVARPDDTVVRLAGDGSLVMNSQEMATAAHHDIAVKVFLMNNGHFGMVRQWQELFWEERYQSVEMGDSPDWVKLDAYGWTGMRCAEKGELGVHAHRARDRRPGAARRAGEQRELLPDDSGRACGAGHGGMSFSSQFSVLGSQSGRRPHG